MKKNCKKNRKACASLFLALLMILCCVSLAGCQKTQQGQGELPDVVTDLSFDFETGEFSFSDVENARSYNVRLFEADPSEDTADMPMAARRVRDREGYDAYTGFVNLSDLQPGTTYDAIVYTYAKDSNGDLVNAISEPVTGVYKTAYADPSKAGGVSCVIEGGTVTVTLNDDFFTQQYLDKAPGYQITLYSGSKVEDSVTLAFSDLEVITTTSTNSSGQEETTTETVGAAAFTVADPAGQYTVTIKLISTDATAYYDSVESAGFAVTEPVPETPGGEGGGMPGEGGFPSGEG